MTRLTRQDRVLVALKNGTASRPLIEQRTGIAITGRVMRGLVIGGFVKRIEHDLEGGGKAVWFSLTEKGRRYAGSLGAHT